ncbi:MAG TPA: cysteine-rich CWC family protein [Candidatus Competibacter phosphatis]|jgi:hypothetical protein|nr:cysteine-rich CWC family protein [Candidatus Competibacteraceae bacterium]HMQ12505.1 cysteine-rich CWC family protein [Candidatus Competibacter phosphatis]HMR02424.1 cysteine-rich CWC family protein [Candidatus Competibacter phosphatis]
MIPMEQSSSRCPLCGQPNECGIAAGQSTCWCFETRIPPEVLEKVPPELRGVTCVCKACATGRRSPEETLERFHELLRERS